MDAQRFEDGQRLRRNVLGELYEERSLSHAPDVTHPFQELVTAFASGEVW
ncbi:MAG: hypothetical protein ACKVVP_04005 [Chloroflexota bacterium]